MFLHAEAFKTREEADRRYGEITKELAKHTYLTITVLSLALDDRPLVAVVGDEPPFKALESPRKGPPIKLPQEAWRAIIAHHLNQHHKFALEAQSERYTEERDYGDEGRRLFSDGTMYQS